MTILTGNILLDPLQTVTLSAAFAFLSITAFSHADHKERVLAASKDFTNYPIETVRRSLPSIVSRAAVAAVVGVLIRIFDGMGMLGDKTTYKLPIFICVLLTIFVEVFMINRKFTKRGEGRSNCWIKVTIAYTVAIAACAFSTQKIFAAEFYPTGLGSREYLIVPAYVAIYAIAVLMAHLVEKKRNKHR
jgi:type III secretory pathway component EscS